MRNILLYISYDGTDFCGWQKQLKHKNGVVVSTVRTVQEEIEKVLTKIHKQPIEIQGSGRTDSGVHAKAQAANFFSPIDTISIKNYISALNSLLPKDIRVMDVEEKNQDFNARFSAVSRTYKYFMHCGNPLATDMRYVWPIHHYPNVEVLNQMASCLRGEIDCTTFASVRDQSLSKHRYLYNAKFYMEGEKLVFEIKANAFLWKMVRSITGSLIYFEQKGYDAAYFEHILKSQNRLNAGPTAPSTGLFLWNIDYTGERIHP
ncbi:MAG: tRNA pseudouridine(38-40) synthase TruA [Treponema sp. CETP13]|nr:MAG: tRNA pseudouridine(38-40) synthase TruA [Treponema sp. CETP13]